MSARDDRSRRIDGLLLAALLPLALAFLVTSTWWELRTDGGYFPIRFEAAADPDEYPEVDLLDPKATYEGERPLPGDRLVAIDGASLRGARKAEITALVCRAFVRDGSARVELQRGEARFETRTGNAETPIWWTGLPFRFAILFSGVALLLRAPHWRLRRHFFVASVAFGIAASSLLPPALLVNVRAVQAVFVVYSIATPLALALSLSIAWELTESARPLALWQRVQPWLLGQALFALFLLVWFAARPLAVAARSVGVLVAALGLVSILGGLTRAYRRSDALERRQIRWVVLGFYVALLPQILILLAFALGVLPPRATPSGDLVEAVRRLAFAAMPLGIFVSVLGYRWLDVDRLISATASYTVLGAIVLGGAVAGVPRLAEAGGALVGVSPAASQWALSLGFAVAVVQAHRRLRPWLDARLFADRVRVEQGLGRLVEELSRCGSAEELTGFVGERLDELLRPQSIVTYARSEGAFTPVFSRAGAAPPAFAADGVLARALETRASPLSASDSELGPFDRAALATLAAEVVIPTRRGDALIAFTCLGRKRSGDIYTPAELALLAAIASASAEVLQRMSDAEVLRQARAMQERMRRYVPGVIAEQISSGRELDAREREVTVVFIDVRGYSSFTAPRASADVFSAVNEHTERVSRIVREHGGAVVEFNGDGMMAVFGAPEALEQKERRAVQAAREIALACGPDLAVGVGIATGLGYSGNIRAADRWIWSVIGDTTNVASRLQALTRELDASIAVDAGTRLAAGHLCADFVLHRDVQLRGRSGRLDVYALPLAAGA